MAIINWMVYTHWCCKKAVHLHPSSVNVKPNEIEMVTNTFYLLSKGFFLISPFCENFSNPTSAKFWIIVLSNRFFSHTLGGRELVRTFTFHHETACCVWALYLFAYANSKWPEHTSVLNYNIYMGLAVYYGVFGYMPANSRVIPAGGLILYFGLYEICVYARQYVIRLSLEKICGR